MQKYAEIKPFLWQQLVGHDRIEAVLKDGKIVRWSSDTVAPILIYERPRGVAGTGLELPLAGAAMLLLALTSILWPIAASVRRHYHRTPVYAGRRALAYRLVRICAVLALIAIGLWTMVLAQVSATNGVDVEAFLHGAQLLSLAAFAGGLGAAVWNLLLVSRDGGWIARLHAIALAAANSVMLWISLNYHLIGATGQY
jgi:hypothetical protein